VDAVTPAGRHVHQPPWQPGWHSITKPAARFWPSTDDRHGFLVGGSNGSILETEDGGPSWQERSLRTLPEGDNYACSALT